jgi:hypothetical protein
METAQIEVVRQDSETYQVIVQAKTRTVHVVTLKNAYHQKLTCGKATPEKLIEKSFEFLLERESNVSILSRFELPLIKRYFPEYEKIIVTRF